MSAVVRCAQCGARRPAHQDRCATCGAVIDISVVLRRQRWDAVLDVLGREWYEWLGEAVAIVTVGGVVAELLPIWALVLSGLLLLRPASRLVLMAIRALLETSPSALMLGTRVGSR